VASVRKRVLLAALATVHVATAFSRLDGQQWLRDRPREPEILRAFALEKTACLADHRSGRHISSSTHEKLVAMIRELGRLRVDEVVPELTFLLDNEILPDACIDALGEIADDRAIFALVGRALSASGSAGEEKAGQHLRRIAVPIYPILVRGLSAPDPLVRRRATILLGRLPYRFRMLRQSIAEDATLFELPPRGAEALLPRFEDPSPQARFEAVRSYLSLGGDPSTARSILARESILSIRDLLDGIPGVLASREHQDWSPRVPYNYFAVRSAAAHQNHRPTTEDHRHVSDWRAFRDGLEIRVSLPEAMLTLPEPQFELNRPVWIRAEIRNPGPAPRSLRGAGSDAPFVTLWLRDTHGRFERIRRAEVEVVADRAGGSGAAEVTLDSGDVAIVELNLIRGVSLRFDGSYGIAVIAKCEEPPILEFSVQGLPEPAWLTQIPSPLGIDPSRIYFEEADVSLPPAPPELRDRAPVSSSSSGAHERLAPETEATLRRFLTTKDRRLLYDLTRLHSAKELSTNLLQLPLTIAPSSKTRPRQLIDRQAAEPSDDLVDLRVLRGDAATYHVLVERRFLVPIPDRLGNQQSWRSEILYSMFRNGGLSEPVVVCEGCSNPAASITPDGALWLISADAGGLSAQRLSQEGVWSPPESILEEIPRMLRGFDLAIDSLGRLFVVWAPWNGNDLPASLGLRVRDANGWQPAESLLLPSGLTVRNPRARWLNGDLGIFAAAKEGSAAGEPLGLFVIRERGRLDHRKFDVNGSDLESAPSGEPLLFVQHFYHPALTAELQQFRAVGLTPKGNVAELGSLMAPEGGYSLGPAVDSTGRPLILAGWNGHNLLLRRSEPAQSQAALLTLASKSDVADFLGSPKPPTIGHPQLFVTGDRFVAFWLETLWRVEGTQPRPRESRLWYLSGSLSDLEWRDVTELAVALRPTTGLLRSDLGYLGRTAIAEALAADERGETLAAMERFVWLIESSRDLGRFLEPESASAPSTWIQQRFRNGDAEVRQRLWTLAAERPLFFAPDSSLLGLLAEEIRPQERVERSKSESRPD
jgi:hypothetical protein